MHALIHKCCKYYLKLLYFMVFISSAWAQPQAQLSTENLIATKDSSYNNVYTLVSRLKKNEKELDDFIKLCRSHNYKEGLALGLNFQGLSFRNASKYDAAIKKHKEAISWASQCSEKLFKATCLNMLGVVYRRINRVKEALDSHKEALELLQNHKNNNEYVKKSLAVSHNSIGNIYLTMREAELAEKEFIKSMKIESSIDNKLGLAINYHNLGSIYEEKGLLDKAKEYFEISLDYNRQISSDYGIVICKNSIGHIFLLQKEYKKAYDIVKPTISIAEKNGDMFYIVETYTNMGWIQMGLQEYHEADKWLQQALAKAKEKGLQEYIAENYRLLALLEEKKGTYKKAYEYAWLFYENEKKYLNNENQNYVTNLIMKYDSERKKSRIDLLEKENELVNYRLSKNKILFSGAVLSLILGCFLLYFMYRQYKLKSEKELLHMEQTMLRSQMNPHFIFNSLNSIKLYIISNEKNKAAYYLNKFSKLIRKILNNSQESGISLEQELETMKLYINIENIRFSSKINFSIGIDPQINSSLVKIPSMILQPFLENAIWHGLATVKHEKILIIRAYPSEDFCINLEIEDNGIGREKAKSIKAGKSYQSKSIGIELTDKRLQNFYKNTNKNHQIEIVDLKDEKGKAKGTKVILKIPDQG